MHFASLSEFFHMGGYAFYVWLSYGVTCSLLIGLVVISVGSRKRLFHDIVRKQQREQKLKEYRSQNQ